MPIKYIVGCVVDINGVEVGDDILGGSDGAVDAILKGSASHKKKMFAPSMATSLDFSSNGSDEECTIVYSIPGNSIQWSRGKMRPPIESKSLVLVKTKLVSLGAP